MTGAYKTEENTEGSGMATLPSIGGLWVSPTEEDGDTHSKGNPPDEVIKMMENHGQHGILMSGLLSWIETNRHTAAGTIWRQVAETAWGYDEVTEDKKLLVSVLTPELTDLIKQEKDKDFVPARTGRDREIRKVRDISDIVNILEFLSDKSKMPLLMASPCQMRKTPKSLGSLSPDATMGEMATKIQSLESCLDKYMELTKNQFQTVTELVMKQNAAIPREVTSCEKPTVVETATTPKENTNDIEVVMEVLQNSYAEKVLGNHPISRNSQSPHQPQAIQNLSQVQTHQQLLNNVLKNSLAKKVETKKTMEKPKGRNIFHGKAKPAENEEEIEIETDLAADVELVAFGVNKSAEPEHLKKFLTEKGIKVEEVKCLTNLELIKEGKVRAKTKKVTDYFVPTSNLTFI